MTHFNVRPFARTDVPAVVAVMNAADAVDQLERGMSSAEFEHMLDAPIIEPARDVCVAESATGALVGMAFAVLRPPGTDDQVVSIFSVTDPSVRRTGVARALITHAMTQLRARLPTDAAPGLPVYLQVGHDARATNAAAFCRTLGFTPVRYFFNMLYADLSVPPTVPPLVPEFTLVTWEQALDRGFHHAVDEAFEDHWDHIPIPYDYWVHEREVPTWHPDLWLGVLTPDEHGVPTVAGATLCAINAQANARTGRQEGSLDIIAVRRPWRKRGLASAMIVAGLQALRAHGMQAAHLTVDAANPSGALGLYERHGFVERRRYVVQRRLLD